METTATPRNVFISFLGTTNYKLVIYQWSKDEKSEPVRFIQEAILEHIAKDWTENDRIFIFYTKTNEENGNPGSYEKNWLNDGHVNDKYPIKDIERVGLCERLSKLKDRLGFKAKIEPVEVKEGFSEKDVWVTFDVVYSKLQKGDKIHFDITHAFRSIPMFASSLLNYAQYMLDVEVVSINYGAFEKLGPAYLVEKMPMEERIAPIVDMTNIVKLQKLTETATSIKEFGRIKKVSENLSPDLSTNSGSAVDEIAKAIKELDEAIQTSSVTTLKEGKIITRFKQNFKKSINSTKLQKAEKELLIKVNEELKGFVGENNYKNVEAAIDWTRGHEMLSQAATLAQEYIISYTNDVVRSLGFSNPYIEPNKKEDNKKRKLFREYIGSILGIDEKDLTNRKYEGKLASYPDLADKLFNLDFIKCLRIHYDDLRKTRNSLNHGNGDKTYDDLKNIFNKSYENCIHILHQYPLENE
jgi:CRISPR-associated Csx2 family protein